MMGALPEAMGTFYDWVESVLPDCRKNAVEYLRRAWHRISHFAQLGTRGQLPLCSLHGLRHLAPSLIGSPAAAGATARSGINTW